MKNVLLVAVMSFGALVFAAEPKVGDKVVYKTFASGLSGFTTIELTSFNAASNSFTRKQTTAIAGQTFTEEQEVRAEDLASTEKYELILNNCAAVGGIQERLTVDAGTFNTCHIISDESNSSYIAAVPFGIVKGIFGNVILELSSFAYGK